jgi:chloramphenicol-sensitive protein RarD
MFRVTERQRREARGGLIYGLAAYGLWGLMPLYFKAVAEVPPKELLAHRIVWCMLIMVVVLTVVRRWPDLYRCLRQPRTRILLLLSAILVAVNWLIFLYGVWTRQIVQTSLGYFINPLFSVLLGMVFFHERLRPGQWLAVGLASLGLAYLILVLGEAPWIALGLAGSFGLYGLIRKIAPVDGLLGLAVETLLLTPAALAALAFWGWNEELSFPHLDDAMRILLVLSGLITAVPLLCFGQAARRLQLSTLGFIQYLAPTMQFLLAVLLFGEPFRPEQQISFGLIWTALLLFTLESLYVRRGRMASQALPMQPVTAPLLLAQPSDTAGTASSSRTRG